MRQAARDSSPSRREEILAVAAAVFARDGVAGSTVRDIADEAGILSGSLYHHFESKDQMVEEILRPAFDGMLTGYQGVLAANLSPEDTIRGLIEVGIGLVMRDPVVGTIIRNDSRQLQRLPRFEFVAKYKHEIKTVFLAALRRGVQEGRFRKGLDTELTYYAMVDAILGSVRYADRTEFPRGYSVRSVVDRVADLFVPALTVR